VDLQTPESIGRDTPGRGRVDASDNLPGVVVQAFIGGVAVPFVGPGGETSQTFGADERIKVSRRWKTEERSAGNVLSSPEETKAWTTEIKNFGPRQVVVSVIDAIPTSLHKDVSVEPLFDAAKPTRKEASGTPGTFAIDVALPPGGSRTLELGWRVKWPNGQRIVKEERKQ
jgi:hypothetical protein